MPPVLSSSYLREHNMIIVEVARTITDLDGQNIISYSHITEAI